MLIRNAVCDTFTASAVWMVCSCSSVSLLPCTGHDNDTPDSALLILANTGRAPSFHLCVCTQKCRRNGLAFLPQRGCETNVVIIYTYPPRPHHVCTAVTFAVVFCIPGPLHRPESAGTGWASSDSASSHYTGIPLAGFVLGFFVLFLTNIKEVCTHAAGWNARFKQKQMWGQTLASHTRRGGVGGVTGVGQEAQGREDLRRWAHRGIFGVNRFPSLNINKPFAALSAVHLTSAITWCAFEVGASAEPHSLFVKLSESR